MMIVMDYGKEKVTEKTWKQLWGPVCAWICRPDSRFLKKAASTALLYENETDILLIHVEPC